MCVLADSLWHEVAYYLVDDSAVTADPGLWSYAVLRSLGTTAEWPPELSMSRSLIAPDEIRKQWFFDDLWAGHPDLAASLLLQIDRRGAPVSGRAGVHVHRQHPGRVGAPRQLQQDPCIGFMTAHGKHAFA
ncbi:hypothetical protein ACQEUU_18230 [Nonomuraea sp. CA-218870]|uniref:hypothetical protein n=1 Tax=Nonomuraea sp. CA-218870 TaxID=3239998 RepID=UPI003D8A0195